MIKEIYEIFCNEINKSKKYYYCAHCQPRKFDYKTI